MPGEAKPRVMLGRLEDGRAARRAFVMRGLFVVGCVAWTVLATWWAIYFYRATTQVRDATLRAYAAEAQVHATDLEQLRLQPAQAQAELAGTIFALAPRPVPPGPFPSVVLKGTLEGYAVTVGPKEQRRLQTDLHRKYLMLAGEGSVLVGLLFACLIGLYRMLAGEVRLRRQQESFVHSVTHELKSPLAGLRALLQSFETLQLSKDERRIYLTLGLGEIDRLDQLVGNILLSSRLEANGYQPQLTQVDLASVLARLRERKQLLFQDKGGSLDVKVASPHAKADPEALETILENLLDNALKYAGGHPHVTVATRTHGGRTVVDVSDNGVGLSRAEQARVFQKFYRAPSGEVQLAKGSGLGLFIARGLARACGGDLKVWSAGPGKGCTFSLELTA
jgi:signal transduction histidine kinase